MSVDSASALVSERLGQDAAPAFSAACHSATGGNPLLLVELLKALAVEGVQPEVAHIGVVADLGSAAVSRAVLLRLRRLPNDAIALANAIAVLGDGADCATAAALAGLTTEAAAIAATALVQAEILQPDASAAFVHPLVGAVVYSDQPMLGRAAQHEQAATLLTAVGAPPRRSLRTWRWSPLRGTGRGPHPAARRPSRPPEGCSGERGRLPRPRARRATPSEERAAVLLELGRAESLTSGPAAAEHLAEAYEMLDEPGASHDGRGAGACPAVHRPPRRGGVARPCGRGRASPRARRPSSGARGVRVPRRPVRHGRPGRDAALGRAPGTANDVGGRRQDAGGDRRAGLGVRRRAERRVR